MSKALTALFCRVAQMTEMETLDSTATYLSRNGYNVELTAEYAICTPRKPSPVALVAHCDTVAGKEPSKFSNKCGVISTKGGGVLGADDRAGIAGIISVIACGARPHVILTTGEEIGGKGANKLARSGYRPPETLHVLLQLDRQGGLDYVTYDCESPILDKWVERFGFKHAIGSFSDISILAPEWEIAAANLAVGYYGQHSQSEYLVIPQLQHTIDRVLAMLKDPPAKRIDYVETSWRGYSGNLHRYNIGGWDSWEQRPVNKIVRFPRDPSPLARQTPTVKMSADDSELELTPLAGEDDSDIHTMRRGYFPCENCQVSCDEFELDGRGWCEDCVADFGELTKGGE